MSERLRTLMWLAPAGLLLVLAAALLLPDPDGLTLAAREGDDANTVQALVTDLEPGALVTLAFDPDVGTYAEIRPSTRALLAQVLALDVTVAVVSLTPEGRGLLLAELPRADAATAAVVDLGFAPGAEAAVAALSRGHGLASGGRGELPSGGVAASDLLIVIGGNDIGPRTWVEQFLPRVGEVPVVAVTPTVLLPEVLPYLETGQVDALVGTPGDTAELVRSIGSGDSIGADRPQGLLAVLVGLIAAAAVLLQALAARFVPSRPWRRAQP